MPPAPAHLTKHLAHHGSSEALLTLTRISETPDGRATAGISRFFCRSSDEGAALLARVMGTLGDDGFARVIAPVDGPPWRRTAHIAWSDGSAPFMFEFPDRPNELSALRASGFETATEHVSVRVDLADLPPATENPTITAWDGSDVEAMLGDLHAAARFSSLASLFTEEIDEEEFRDDHRLLLFGMDRRLVLVARDASGEVAGAAMGYPNHLSPQPATAVLVTCHSRTAAVETALRRAFEAAAAAAGYAQVIHSLMPSGAEKSHLRGKVFRRYVFLYRDLAP